MASRDTHVDDKKIAVDEIREIQITSDITDPKRRRLDVNSVPCDVCLNKTLSKNVALFICFECEVYLCFDCFGQHEQHDVMKAGNDEKTVDAGIERLIESVRNENDMLERFERENNTVCNRIYLKHPLDQTDCWITGLCGIDDKTWVVCDCFNFSIKLLTVGNNSIQRYIRLGAKPYDVTAINIKQDHAISKSINITHDKESGYLFGVTFPGQRQILFIDANKVPATVFHKIQTGRKCHSIEFFRDKIFTVCEENPNPDISTFFIHIMSIDGEVISIIDTNIYRVVMFPPPYLSISSEKIYITNWSNHTVQCFDFIGNVIAEHLVENSWPYGITIDEDSNVYICAGRDVSLFHLTADLKHHKKLVSQSSVYIDFPRDLCIYQNKLYISHFLGSPLGNFVSVVQLI